MKLSIVTINYNNAEGLKRTLESVYTQTYQEFEHVIIDGGSSDGSVPIIRSYEEHIVTNRFNQKTQYPLFSWVSERDNGIYHAMNKGIKRASGEYIQILNSGDILAASDVTERMIAKLDALNDEMSRTDVLDEPHTLNDGVPILYGNMLKSYDMKTIVNRDTCGERMYTPESFLYFYNGTLNHDCAYIRRDLFEKYGLYNEQMKICSDWEWYVRAIVLGGEKPVYTNIDVTIFDLNGVSESMGKNAELIKKERREYLEKILPPAILHDYDQFAFPILQYQRLKKYHLWGVVYFMERVLFKLEKWHILK